MSSPGGRPHRASRATALVLLHVVLGGTAATQASSLTALVAVLVVPPTVLVHAAAVADVVSAVRPTSSAQSARARLIWMGRRSLLIDVLPYLAIGMQLVPQLVGTASEAGDVVLCCAFAAVPLRMYMAWWAPMAIANLPAPADLPVPESMEQVLRTSARSEILGLRLMIVLAVVVAGPTALLTFGLSGRSPGISGVFLFAVVPVVTVALRHALADGARAAGELVRFGRLGAVAVDAAHRAAGSALPTVYAAYTALAAAAMVDQVGTMVVASLSAIGPSVYRATLRQWQVLRLAVGDEEVFRFELERAGRRNRALAHQPR